MKTFPIERIAKPSRAFFEKHYVNQNRPVVIQGEVDGWPAAHDWTLDSVRDQCGDVEVTVEVFADGKTQGHEGYTTRRMPLRRYMELLYADDYQRYYMADQMLEDTLPGLLADVPDPPMATGPIDRRVIFLGRDSYSPNHFHADCEYLTSMLWGEKRFQLFAPNETKRMYPRSDRHLNWYTFSKVDPHRDDIAESFPEYDKALAYETVIKPGEMIYIPVHWWHNVWGYDLGLTLVHTWKSSKRNWGFPQPGLRVARQRLVFRSVELARRAARKVNKSGQLASWLVQNGYIDETDRVTE